MLVLARKSGESLIIDEVTEIRVLEIRGDRVRLGIRAPLNVNIRRTELQFSISMEKDSLLGSSMEPLNTK